MVDELMALETALARRMAEPKGKAVVEGSTSAPPAADPASRRRPRPTAMPEPLKTEPTLRARTGQPSAAKRQRVAPRVAG